MNNVENKKECWEIFSVPKVTKGSGLKNGDDTIVLEFYCHKANIGFNVYYPEDEIMSYELLSEVINRVLSICHDCKEKTLRIS